MQQQQRRDRAAKLTAIRARLGNALATEEVPLPAILYCYCFLFHCTV